MSEKEFAQYAKEHGLIVLTEEKYEQRIKEAFNEGVEYVVHKVSKKGEINE